MTYLVLTLAPIPDVEEYKTRDEAQAARIKMSFSHPMKHVAVVNATTRAEALHQFHMYVDPNRAAYWVSHGIAKIY